MFVRSTKSRQTDDTHRPGRSERDGSRGHHGRTPLNPRPPLRHRPQTFAAGVPARPAALPARTGCSTTCRTRPSTAQGIVTRPSPTARQRVTTPKARSQSPWGPASGATAPGGLRGRPAVGASRTRPAVAARLVRHQRRLRHAALGAIRGAWRSGGAPPSAGYAPAELAHRAYDVSFRGCLSQRASLTRNRRARSWKAASPPSNMSQTALRISALSRPPAL